MDGGRGTQQRRDRQRAKRTSPESDTGRLVTVCGLPGVGKTLVSERIADRLDGRLIRTDVVRKELFPEPEYTSAERQSVYDELFSRGRESIQNGTPAVLDATFRKREDRDRAASVATAADVPLEIVQVECDTQVVRERIAAREDDESDADFEIYLKFRDRFEHIEREHETVDNSGDMAETRRQIDAMF
ncbi:kinase [Halogeometricum borinquense DSM 11551]|uniref:Kinase n=2 Tax=Halogeometricum borinquense TaxID=60847 RepID=E4NRS7_HALBP|nr:AAA family ATPase [Halogeometricum borinquense]ADQ66864.1 predicted kinase [Halogeometricum borinquense DSM 11551]ELY30372.1 kinase [Halogeometricum borinquense DSM 11551]